MPDRPHRLQPPWLGHLHATETTRVIADAWEPSVHRVVLDELEATRSNELAGRYARFLTSNLRRSGRRALIERSVIEVAQAIGSFPVDPKNEESLGLFSSKGDLARLRKELFIDAACAAVRLRNFDEAASLLTRADTAAKVRVFREKSPTIVALRNGQLESRREGARAKAKAKNAASALSDDELGDLRGLEILRRLAEGPGGQIWVLDLEERLAVFQDGEIVTAPCEVFAGPESHADVVASFEAAEERLTTWRFGRRDVGSADDITRYGATLIWHAADVSSQGSEVTAYHLRFGDHAAATSAMTAWRCAKSKGVESASFHGKRGYVYRRYGTLEPGWVVAGASLFDPTKGGDPEVFPSSSVAEAEHERRETALFRGGAKLRYLAQVEDSYARPTGE